MVSLVLVSRYSVENPPFIRWDYIDFGLRQLLKPLYSLKELYSGAKGKKKKTISDIVQRLMLKFKSQRKKNCVLWLLFFTFKMN